MGYIHLNPSKTGMGEAIIIFWTINDPSGLERVQDLILGHTISILKMFMSLCMVFNP